MREAVDQHKIRLWTHKLREEYRQILFTYNLKLHIPVIQIDEHSQRWGAWDPQMRTISLSKQLIENHPWDTVVEIFKHEMAHQLVTDSGAEELPHGMAFKAACEKLGVAPWACRAETNELPPQSSLKVSDASSEEKRLLERAEKLLSLATSDNEHEALLAMQKVQELYAKYNLNRIQEKKGAQWGYWVIKLKKKRVERYQSVIAAILNDHFFVEVIHTSQFDAEDCCDYKALELLGTRENVLMAEYVFHFLKNQLSGLWKAYAASKKRTSIASKNSFFLGVLEGFREKLDLSQAQIEKNLHSEAGKSLVVMVQEDQELEALVTRRHPKLTRLRGGRRLHDGHAFKAGRKEGQSLVIRRGISRQDGNQKKLLRS